MQVAGDAIYTIDYVWVIVAALAATLLSAVMAVAAAHGGQRELMQGRSGGPPRGGLQQTPSNQSRERATSKSGGGGYQLFVCDRPLTLVLTMVGMLAVGLTTIAALTTAAHMQHTRVVDQGARAYSTFPNMAYNVRLVYC